MRQSISPPTHTQGTYAIPAGSTDASVGIGGKPPPASSGGDDGGGGASSPTGDDEEESMDWWTKYFASVDAMIEVGKALMSHVDCYLFNTVIK